MVSRITVLWGTPHDDVPPRAQGGGHGGGRPRSCSRPRNALEGVHEPGTAVGPIAGPDHLPAATRGMVPRRAAHRCRSDPRRQRAATLRSARFPASTPHPASHVVGCAATARRRDSTGELGPAIRRVPALLCPGAAASRLGHHALPRLWLRLRDWVVRLALARVRAHVGQPGCPGDREGSRGRCATVEPRRAASVRLSSVTAGAVSAPPRPPSPADQ